VTLGDEYFRLASKQVGLSGKYHVIFGAAVRSDEANLVSNESAPLKLDPSEILKITSRPQDLHSRMLPTELFGSCKPKKPHTAVCANELNLSL
jgi:hypothetical protein